MRCTYTLCQGGNTKLIERRVTLQIDGGEILDYEIRDLYLCNNCGNPFRPACEKVDLNRGRRLTQNRIIGNIFDGLSFRAEKVHPRYVQLQNPRTKHWVLVDRWYGRLTRHKKSAGPYKNVPIYEKGHSK